MHHHHCEIDRRTVRVKPTVKGREIRGIVADLFQCHAGGMIDQDVIGEVDLQNINAVLRRLERYWTDQIRDIY